MVTQSTTCMSRSPPCCYGYSNNIILLKCLLVAIVAILSFSGQTSAFIFGDFNEPSPAVMEPHLVELEENAQLELTCRVSDSYNDTHNASQIYFQKIDIYQIGHPYFLLVSSHEAKLHVPMATYEHWRGVVMCGLINVTTNFIHVNELSAMVVFRRDPLPPSLDSCVVHNWESLACDWSPTIQAQIAHTQNKHHVRYKFMWSFVPDHHTYYCCNDPDVLECPRDGVNLTNTCRLTVNSTVNTFSMGALYELSVRAETDKAFSVAKWRNGTTFNTSQQVKPSPPEHLSVLSHNHTHGVISWSRPSTTWLPAYSWTLQYNVVVSSNRSKANYSVLSASHQVSLYVPMYHYVTYSVTVDVIPEVGGYRSDSVHANFLSPPTVPDINPGVLPAGYFYGSCGEVCGVTLYWQPLEDTLLGGPNFRYIIKTRKVGTSSEGATVTPDWETAAVIADPRQSSVTMEVSGKGNVQVAVHAANDYGENTHSRNIINIVPKQELLPVDEHLIIESSEDDNRLFVWIDHPRPIDAAATYSVFWTNRNDKAAGPLGWSMLSPDNHSFTLSLPSSAYHYRFGLTKTLRGINSGIVWREEAVYSMASAVPVLPPSEFRVQEATMYSLTLTWHPHIYQRAYVKHYKLRFCEKDTRTETCKEPVRYMTQMILGTETEVELTGLVPGTEYNISISSVTRDRESAPVYVQDVARTTPGLSAVAVAGIVAGAIVGFVICTIGIYTYCKKCREIKKWFSKGIPIKFPEEAKSTRESTSSEMPLFRSSGSSYVDYRRQISAVSDLSSEGELYSYHGDDSGLDDNLPGYLRVSCSPKSLDSIPENNDDVFDDTNSEKVCSSEGMFVKSYKLVPSKDPVSPPTDAWTKMDPGDSSCGGISKYAVLSLQQNTPDDTDPPQHHKDDHHVLEEEKSRMQAVNELFHQLLSEDSLTRRGPSSNDTYVTHKSPGNYVAKDWSVSPGNSRLGSPSREPCELLQENQIVANGMQVNTLNGSIPPRIKLSDTVPNGHGPIQDIFTSKCSTENKIGDGQTDSTNNNNQSKQIYIPVRSSPALPPKQSYINMKPNSIPMVADINVV